MSIFDPDRRIIRDRSFPRGKNFSKRYPFTSEPITSYGLLLYSFRENNVVFLLYQRRDSFEYMDFMRGCWSTDGQLRALFSLMSQEERQRIREYTFQELWDDLWVSHKCRLYQDGFKKAKRKYDSIKHLIPSILDSTNSYICAPPWGWPKGKKNGYYEDSLSCALREFKEETHIDISAVKIINQRPYIEDFKGSNGKAYSTQYYLCELPEPVNPTPMETPQCIRKTTISEEASNVGWFTFEEACTMLNSRRQSILRTTLEYIKAHLDKSN